MTQHYLTSPNVKKIIKSRKIAYWGAKFFLAPCFFMPIFTISWEQRKLGECAEFNEEIKTRQAVITAIRDYWRLKPIIAKYKAILDSKTKELFYVENMADIEQYNKVTEVLNANKLPDGMLPKTEQLKAEIAEYKQTRALNYDNKDKAKSELQKYEVLMDNIKTVIKDEPQKAGNVER